MSHSSHRDPATAAWNFAIDLPPGEFDAFIFDCDGTLIDSMPLHLLAWQAAFRKFHAPFEFTEEMHHAQAGASIPETVAVCNARFGTDLDPHAVAQARLDYFFTHLDALQPVGPVIDFARAQLGKKTMAVASGSERSVVVRELEHLGLSDWFPVVVTASDVARGKPHPDLFLKAAHDLGVAPEKCLVFEDGHNGIVAATAAGMASVYIPTND